MLSSSPEEDARNRAFCQALAPVAERLGLDADGVRLLRLHGSGIYLLPAENMVVRLVEADEENRRRAQVAVNVTTWLVAQDFPCVRPAHDAPLEADGSIATLWEYLPQPESTERTPAAVLGALVRRLHHLGDPPVRLPVVDPLGRLRRALALDEQRADPVIRADQGRYLRGRMAELKDRYDQLDFPLSRGLIHNDAHLGNLLADPTSPQSWVLADWDGAARGPREIDLVQEGAPGNRFGHSEEERIEFSAAYGYDVASWPGWHTLQDMRYLHSLAAYIRLGPEKQSGREELEARLGGLMEGRGRPWRASA